MTYYVYELTLDHPILGRLTYIGSHCYQSGHIFQFDYAYHGSSTFCYRGETFKQMVERYPHRCVPLGYAFSNLGRYAQEKFYILNKATTLGWFEDGGRVINRKSSLAYLDSDIQKAISVLAPK